MQDKINKSYPFTINPTQLPPLYSIKLTDEVERKHYFADTNTNNCTYLYRYPKKRDNTWNESTKYERLN